MITHPALAPRCHAQEAANLLACEHGKYSYECLICQARKREVEKEDEQSRLKAAHEKSLEDAMAMLMTHGISIQQDSPWIIPLAEIVDWGAMIGTAYQRDGVGGAVVESAVKAGEVVLGLAIVSTLGPLDLAAATESAAVISAMYKFDDWVHQTYLDVESSRPDRSVGGAIADDINRWLGSAPKGAP